MALDYDPTTGRFGVDWPVLRQAGVRLDHASKAAAGAIPSTATETVTTATLPLVDIVGTPTLILDVYDPATPTGALTTTTYRPNEDASAPAITNAATFVGSPTNTAGNRYQNIDEATLDTADYLDFNSGATTPGTGTYGFRVASAAGFGAGSQTVSEVRVKAIITRTLTISYSSVTYALYYNNGSTEYLFGTPQSFGVVTLTGQTITFSTTTNPATGRPWTEAEVQAFDSTANFRLLITPTNQGDRSQIFQVFAEVDWRNNPLIGTAQASPTGAGWWTFPFLSPLSKVNGTPWRWVLRRDTASAGSAVVPLFDSDETSPFGWTTYKPTLDGSGVVTAWGDSSTAVMPLIMIVGGVAGANSLPYFGLFHLDIATGSTSSQEITLSGTTTIGWVRTAISAQSVNGPSAPLLLKVKTSAGVLQATATIDPSVIADAPTTPRAVDATLDTAVSLVAGQYRIEASSTAPAGEGWTVPALWTSGQSNAASFGGTTDVATIAGTESADFDLAMVFGTVPTAPAGFTLTPNTTGEGSLTCAWTVTALGGSFDYYIIELQIGSTWYEVARINTESVNAYEFEACRRGVAETMRIRVRHTNGTMSLPSASDTDTLTKTGTYLIVPESPTLSRSFELNPAPGFSYPRDSDHTARFGMRYLQGTRATQDRGLVLSGVIETTGTAGFVAAAQWTRDLLDADVNQFVLVNGLGERWYVDLEFGDGTSISFGDTGDHQPIAVSVFESDDVPVIVEVS